MRRIRGKPDKFRNIQRRYVNIVWLDGEPSMRHAPANLKIVENLSIIATARIDISIATSSISTITIIITVTIATNEEVRVFVEQVLLREQERQALSSVDQAPQLVDSRLAQEIPAA